MSSKSASVPKIPKGKDLEEFVAAFFQSSGFYIERSIIQREQEEILELDILATNYNVSPPDMILSEVKSGGWGFSDLFKLRGWLHYLSLNKAVFVATKNKDNLDFYTQKADELGTQLTVIPDLKEAAEPLSPITNISNPDELDIETWRFSYWLDRVLTTDLIHKKKSTTTEKRFLALNGYLHAVNSGAFFCQTISERMEMLCSEYKAYPNISARVAAEMSGKNFDHECDVVDAALFRKTFYDCEYNDLQLSTFVEHRARLALMKYATDYILYCKAGRMDLAKDSCKLKILGHEFDYSSFDGLPVSFREGIESIEEEPFFHRYPVFWQWFMWVYGGFILLDKQSDEFTHMSKRTGIPAEEIPRALQAYDTLFPTPSTWFVDTSPNARLKKLKLFPIPFMGLGAHYRKEIYCPDGKFSSLGVTGIHTINDLIAWNNSSVHALTK